ARQAELRRADGGEVGRMREKHDPRVAGPLVETDATDGSVLLEVGDDIAQAKGGHGEAPLGCGWRELSIIERTGRPGDKNFESVYMPAMGMPGPPARFTRTGSLR